jgi:hypothetical protein
MIIGYLKKAGVTPNDFEELLQKNTKAIERINSVLLPIVEKKN